MTQPTCVHSSAELCREQFKAFLNQFFIPIALQLCFRSGIMREFLKEIVGMLDMIFVREISAFHIAFLLNCCPELTVV